MTPHKTREQRRLENKAKWAAKRQHQRLQRRLTSNPPAPNSTPDLPAATSPTQDLPMSTSAPQTPIQTQAPLIPAGSLPRLSEIYAHNCPDAPHDFGFRGAPAPEPDDGAAMKALVQDYSRDAERRIVLDIDETISSASTSTDGWGTSYTGSADFSKMPLAHEPEFPEPATKIPGPVPSLGCDALIAQCSWFAGVDLVETADKMIQFPRAQLGMLMEALQYKRAALEAERQAAIDAANAEIQVDRSRFLDVSQFRSELPDLPVTNHEAISKREPSAAIRAKNLAAAAKCVDTKRLKRLQLGKPVESDIVLFQAVLDALDFGTSATGMTATEVASAVPSYMSIETAAAVLRYLCANHVVRCFGTSNYLTSLSTVDEFNALKAQIKARS